MFSSELPIAMVLPCCQKPKVKAACWGQRSHLHLSGGCALGRLRCPKFNQSLVLCDVNCPSPGLCSAQLKICAVEVVQMRALDCTALGYSYLRFTAASGCGEGSEGDLGSTGNSWSRGPSS